MRSAVCIFCEEEWRGKRRSARGEKEREGNSNCEKRVEREEKSIAKTRGRNSFFSSSHPSLCAIFFLALSKDETFSKTLSRTKQKQLWRKSRSPARRC